jgi:hypothetical protein
MSSVSSVAVVGVGDIAFDSNQCTVEVQDGPPLLANSLVAGHSIRVTGNLFREGIGDVWFSAVCAAPGDTVTDNQGIHCILAVPCLGPYSRVLPNTVVLNPALCLQINLLVNAALFQYRVTAQVAA